MVGRFIGMIADAVRSVRKNFLHTLLSILGIVIGVAALVIILSMIDGMEKYALEQISSTTSLETINITPRTTEVIDGVRLSKDTLRTLNYQEFERMMQEEEIPGKGIALLTEAARLRAGDTSTVGGYVRYINQLPEEDIKVLAGSLPDSVGMRKGSNKVIINRSAADALFPEGDYSTCPGKAISYDSLIFEIAAVVENRQENERASMVASLSSLPRDYLSDHTPNYMIRAYNVSNVPIIQEQVDDWLSQTLGNGHDMAVATNEFRVSQVNKGFLLFRIVMGLIVGVSVVVGGIGIMNVMIISVTERIREIGIRKAVGAKRKEIMMQFLSESVTISGLGSIIGLIAGVLLTLVVVPILRALTEAPFQAAFTWNTLLIVSILAVMIGVVFGTYPALKASRLDPVDAIRHE